MTGAVAAAGGAVGVISYAGFVDALVPGSGGPATYSIGGPGGAYFVTNSAPSNYDIYATVTVGALSSGTTGSWLNLGTAYNWQKNYPGADCTLTFQLRDAFTLSVVKTITVTLSPNS